MSLQPTLPFSGRQRLGVPYQAHSSTSKDAAEALAPRRNALEMQVLRAFAAAPHGLTDGELAQVTGLGETARPRRIKLRDEGLICDSGDRRPSGKKRLMTVWKLTPAGEAELEP